MLYYAPMGLSKIKVISFDLHKTLATPSFVEAVWYEGIPHVYARRQGLSFELAREIVMREYARVDENSRDYFDLNFWSDRLELGGYAAAIEYCRPKLAYYPEIWRVLRRLQATYPLIIATGMPREFIPPIMSALTPFITRVFSADADYSQFKCPGFYVSVCRDMGMATEELLHVGDDVIKDYEMPRTVGVRAIHLDRGGKPAAGGITDLTQLEARVDYMQREV